MRKIQKDFTFLDSVFTRFFQEKHIISRLNEIETLEASGWEIWLQVELLIFLYKQENVSEVYREERCFLDLRKEKLKSLCSLDFIIREKGAHSFIPLEIKQNKEASTCIKNMCLDLDKYNKIRESELPTERDLWLLGVHRTVTREYILKQMSKRLDLDEKFIVTKEIKGTNFMFTLF